MSKRLQVILPDDEYRAVAERARQRGRPISDVVRDSLRRTLIEDRETEPEQRIAAVLRFARHQVEHQVDLIDGLFETLVLVVDRLISAKLTNENDVIVRCNAIE